MAKTQKPWVPKQPEYIIKAWLKGTKEQMKVGAAWINDDGSMLLKFDYFVDMAKLQDPSVGITLCPAENAK